MLEEKVKEMKRGEGSGKERQGIVRGMMFKKGRERERKERSRNHRVKSWDKMGRKKREKMVGN